MSKIILVDGDVVCYRAACSPTLAYDGKRPPTEYEAHKNLDKFMEQIFDGITGWATPEVKYEVFLTGSGNFRYDYAVTADYKGNRKDTVRPEYLSSVREKMKSKYNAVVSEGEEADDLLAIRATELGAGNFVLASTDKDMLQIEGTHWNITRSEIIEVGAFEGLRFFYSQIITGDRADNIIGINGIGPKKVEKLLAACKTEFDLWEVCCEAYVNTGLSIDEARARVQENGILAWLRRFKGQLWYPMWEWDK